MALISTPFHVTSQTSNYDISLVEIYYRNLEDDTLRNHTGTEYKIELLKGAQPCHAKPFPIPKVHVEPLKIKVNRSVNF